MATYDGITSVYDCMIKVAYGQYGVTPSLVPEDKLDEFCDLVVDAVKKDRAANIVWLMNNQERITSIACAFQKNHKERINKIRRMTRRMRERREAE